MQRRVVPDVVRDQILACLAPDATVRAAARLMTERNLGSVLIVEDGHLAGIFTERDMVCRVVAADRDPDQTPLADVMTEEPDTVAPETTALDALRRMDDGGYRHLPVVERGRLVAIVSRRDFAGVEQTQLEQETALGSAWANLFSGRRR